MPEQVIRFSVKTYSHGSTRKARKGSKDVLGHGWTQMDTNRVSIKKHPCPSASIRGTTVHFSEWPGAAMTANADGGSRNPRRLDPAAGRGAVE